MAALVCSAAGPSHPRPSPSKVTNYGWSTRAGERVYYFVKSVYGPRLPPIGLEVYIYSTRSRPITDGWVPNAPPDPQPSLFNESG